MHNQAKNVSYRLMGYRTKGVWTKAVGRTLISATILLLAATSGSAQPALTDHFRPSHGPMMADNIPWD